MMDNRAVYMQEELEAAKSKTSSALARAVEECGELKARLASTRTAAAAAKQAAQQQEFQLQAQVCYRHLSEMAYFVVAGEPICGVC